MKLVRERKMEDEYPDGGKTTQRSNQVIAELRWGFQQKSHAIVWTNSVFTRRFNRTSPIKSLRLAFADECANLP